MVNEDILGGIESGIAKGESIESVMNGLLNAGYHREDIEWAAKAFQLNRLQSGSNEQSKVNNSNPIHIFSGGGKSSVSATSPQRDLQGVQFQNPKSLSMFSKPTIKNPSAYYFGTKSPETKQNVSSYDQASYLKEKMIFFVLVGSILLLIVILGGVFLFREQLADFINNFLG